MAGVAGSGSGGGPATSTSLEPVPSPVARLDGRKLTQGLLLLMGGIDCLARYRAEDIAKADSYLRLAPANLTAGPAVAQTTGNRPDGCAVKCTDRARMAGGARHRRGVPAFSAGRY